MGVSGGILAIKLVECCGIQPTVFFLIEFRRHKCKKMFADSFSLCTFFNSKNCLTLINVVFYIKKENTNTC